MFTHFSFLEAVKWITIDQYSINFDLVFGNLELFLSFDMLFLTARLTLNTLSTSVEIVLSSNEIFGNCRIALNRTSVTIERSRQRSITIGNVGRVFIT
ncbi:hypothetical protein T4C_6960 [Trichinella pseudospiralis]|uniref:Uncharacterized protein n=1 Tax=Trichinella pseudospiralis TaxID=6337 RepID=A0A0V1K1A7_TRIPS|nr:hypothetical protein T4C_6960 [Trichinella pseudospiralis]